MDNNIKEAIETSTNKQISTIFYRILNFSEFFTILKQNFNTTNKTYFYGKLKFNENLLNFFFEQQSPSLNNLFTTLDNKYTDVVYFNNQSLVYNEKKEITISDNLFFENLASHINNNFSNESGTNPFDTKWIANLIQPILGKTLISFEGYLIKMN